MLLVDMEQLLFIVLCLITENAHAESWYLQNSTEYYVSGYETTFENAKSNCENMGQAKLVTIKTKNVQNFLEGLMTTAYPSGKFIIV